MYGAQDPGNWQAFTKRLDIQSLPLMEQKSRFIQEQTNYQNLMESVRAQVNVGGIYNNPIVSVAFAGDDLDTVSGFTSQLIVTYTFPVTIEGSSPVITVSNGQQGGGSAASISYDFNSGGSTLTTLRFDYIQGASATNTGVVAANVISVGVDLVGAGGTVANPTGTVVDADYSIDGTGYTTSGSGTGATFAITISGGVIDIVAPTVAGTLFIPDEIITFNDAVFGAGSLGGSISVDESALTGDILSLSGKSSIGGGVVSNASDNRPVQGTLTKGATKTATAE
jgi:hypothetical protein